MSTSCVAMASAVDAKQSSERDERRDEESLDVRFEIHLCVVVVVMATEERERCV